MRNTNIGNNTGIIGDGNIVIFNIQAPLTREQVEEEFLKLDTGDFQDITNEVDESLRERHITILSYVKNPLLQLKMQLINEDFNEPWLPKVAADMGERKKAVLSDNAALPRRSSSIFLFFHFDGRFPLSSSIAKC